MKYILVVEKPYEDLCVGCPFCVGHVIASSCLALGNKPLDCYPDDGIDDDCPLKPMPQNYCTDGDDIEEDSYCQGWNECIEEIEK